MPAKKKWLSVQSRVETNHQQTRNNTNIRVNLEDACCVCVCVNVDEPQLYQKTKQHMFLTKEILKETWKPWSIWSYEWYHYISLQPSNPFWKGPHLNQSYPTSPIIKCLLQWVLYDSILLTLWRFAKVGWQRRHGITTLPSAAELHGVLLCFGSGILDWEGASERVLGQLQRRF